MRRKRKRRTLNWTPVLWLLLIGNVVAGLLYSPITRLRHVRVDGALAYDQPRITRVVEALQDVPCAQIGAQKAESDFLTMAEARSASLTRNIFGSAILKVGYRRPVARLTDHPDVGLTIDGVLFPAYSMNEGLPTVTLPKDLTSPALTLANAWEPAKLASLAVKAKQLLPQDLLNIQIGDAGVVYLNIGSGRVVIGSLDDIDAKIQALKDYLAKDPEVLSKVKALNIMRPDHPALILKK